VTVGFISDLGTVFATASATGFGGGSLGLDAQAARMNASIVVVRLIGAD